MTCRTPVTFLIQAVRRNVTVVQEVHFHLACAATRATDTRAALPPRFATTTSTGTSIVVRGRSFRSPAAVRVPIARQASGRAARVSITRSLLAHNKPLHRHRGTLFRQERIRCACARICQARASLKAMKTITAARGIRSPSAVRTSPRVRQM